MHSHTYTNPHDIPMAKFSYQLSPMQVVVKEEKKAFYHFITTVCAIVGGVFTIAGILDSAVYTAVKLAKVIC